MQSNFHSSIVVTAGGVRVAQEGQNDLQFCSDFKVTCQNGCSLLNNECPLMQIATCVPIPSNVFPSSHVLIHT